jgi:cell division protein FtsI (penicillin-binding protein 3)
VTTKKLPKKLRTKAKKSRHARLAEMASFRSLLVVMFILSGFIFAGVNLLWLGMVPADEPETKFARTPKVLPVRGDIYDRNGVLLATTLKVKSLYADPKMMVDVGESLFALATVVPTLDFDQLSRLLSNKKKRFVWLKRQLTPEQVKQVNDLGIPGVFFREEHGRVYPHKELASHVIGGIDVDGNGLAGVEASYNESLLEGEDLYLTLDVRLQGQLRQVLLENMARVEAKGTWGVAMNPKNGEILALSSLPDYDPNHYGEAIEGTWFNKAVYGSYEMGSTFKIFTMAQGLEEGYVDHETPLDITKPIRIGRYTINDSHPKYKIMTMEEVFKRSSNIGAARIADLFEEGSQELFFSKLGLLTPLDVGLKEIGRPRYNDRWGRIQTMTRSFGHGLAVTPVQMAAGVGSLVSDGYYKHPHIVKDFDIEEPHFVVSQPTVMEIKALLRGVVEDGTGRQARLEGYSIGGKTGTAEKSEAGGYSKNKNLASFVGVVPADDPEILALIMVDEPKGKDNQGGGSAAAPAFRKFIGRIAPIVGLRPEIKPLDFRQKEIKRMVKHETFPTYW